MSPLPPTPIVPVVQGDREVAGIADSSNRIDYKLGKLDDSSTIQAIARHRIASQAEFLTVGADLIAALLEDYPDDPEEADSAPVEHIGECGQSALTFGHVRRFRAAIAAARGAS